MAYQVIIPGKVQKDLNRIDSRYKERIFAALAVLASNPYAGKGLEGEWKGEWSYRVWPYRILYKIYKKELIILIIRIGHRGGVYK